MSERVCPDCGWHIKDSSMGCIDCGWDEFNWSSLIDSAKKLSQLKTGDSK
jgi:hypothetical protein